MELASSQACNNHQRNKKKRHSIKRMSLMKLRFNFQRWGLSGGGLVRQLGLLQRRSKPHTTKKRTQRKQRKEIYTSVYFTTHDNIKKNSETKIACNWDFEAFLTILKEVTQMALLTEDQRWFTNSCILSFEFEVLVVDPLDEIVTIFCSQM